MRKTKFKKFLLVALSLLFIFSFAACNKASEKTEGNKENTSVPKKEEVKKEETSTEKKPTEKNPLVTIEMEDGGKIKVELYPDKAPNTVRNFVSLVQKGFYDGLIFHRVMQEFMIQGGDPQGTGIGGPGYGIKGEFTANGFKNDLKHERGVISMARGLDANSAGSQFFIMVKEAPHLDGEYAAFGKVIEGIEVADKIVSVETVKNDPKKENRPVKNQKMKKVTVDTFGVKYDELEKVK